MRKNGNCISGMIKLKIMTKHVSIVYLLSFIFLAVLSSCSNEEEEAQKAHYCFRELKFVVNVTNLERKLTRSTTGKSTWCTGDRIVMAIDGSNTNTCTLEYMENGTWNVIGNAEETTFSAETGAISALHADNIIQKNGSIEVQGDIIYTKNATYTRRNNVVEIIIRFDRRPVSRIAVVRTNKTAKLSTLNVINDVSSLVDMTFNTTQGCSPYEVFGDTCVYYGLQDADDNGKTTIQMETPDGYRFERTYAKSMSPGKYYILQGPYSEESSQWTTTVLVHFLFINRKSLNLTPNQDYALNCTLYNKNATDRTALWSSSNERVAKVDANGHVTAVSKGQATIYARAEDGSAEANCSITVDDLANFVNASKIPGSFSLGGTIDGIFLDESNTITVQNNSEWNLYIESYGFSSNSMHVLTGFSNFKVDYSRYHAIQPDESYSFKSSFNIIVKGGSGWSTTSKPQSWFELVLRSSSGETIEKTIYMQWAVRGNFEPLGT